MTSSPEGNDAPAAEDAPRRSTGQRNQAVLGALMCVVALVVVGAILNHASSAPTYHATDVLPASNAPAVTTHTQGRAATVVNKKRVPGSTVTTTTPPTTVPLSTPPTRPTFVRAATARSNTPRVVARTPTPPTPPPTTPPPTAPPPTSKPPDTIAVPIGPTIPPVPTSLPIG